MNVRSMFGDDVKSRLEYLKKDINSIEKSNNQLTIVEKKKEGEANLSITVKNPCIAFKNVDENVFGYLQNTECADDIIFERKDAGDWITHIIELKKTIRNKSWLKVKEQFKGGIINALCIAGFLNIKIDFDKVKLYTGFRYDKMKESHDANPIENKMLVGESSNNIGTCDWDNGQVALEAIAKSLKLEHIKVKLDEETGEGTLSL